MAESYIGKKKLPSLLEGDVSKHILRLGLPVIWGIFMMTLFALVDTWFIARIGLSHLAAFGFVVPVTMTFMGIIFGMAAGITSTLSRAYGAGDMEKFRQMAMDAHTLMGVLAGISAILGFFFIDPLFRKMGATEELMPLIHGFMMVWYIGMPFAGLTIATTATMRATGNTRLASIVMTASAVIMLILDPLFIFGWWGFPRMELTGAAVALTISYIVVFFYALYEIVCREKALGGAFFNQNTISSWRKILHIALPAGISNVIPPLSAGVVTSLAALYGHEAVAAMGVALRLDQAAHIVLWAMGTATAILAGQNFGAGNLGRVRETVAAATRYSMIWGLIVAAVFFGFAQELPQIFGAGDEVSDYTSIWLRWAPISYGAFGALIVVVATLNAAGRPLAALALVCLRAVVLYVPLAWLLQIYFDFTGIPMALMMTNFFVGTIAYFYARKVIS